MYLHSFRIEALKLAAQGVTIVAALGDDGVNCAAGLCCLTSVHNTSVRHGFSSRKSEIIIYEEDLIME